MTFQAARYDARKAKRSPAIVETLIREYPSSCQIEQKSQTAIDNLLARRQDILKKMLGSAQMLQETLSSR